MSNKFYLSIIVSILFFFSCSKPVDKIRNITWEGQIYRTKDDKQLSDVKLKLSNDTMYIFANAIFGAENDTLILQKSENDKNDKDSVYILKSRSGQDYKLQYKYIAKEKGNTFYLIGGDFYIVTGVSVKDIFENGALSFYKNIIVPRDAYMYLNGAYEGHMEAENEYLNMSLLSMGGIKIKLVFIDDFKVRIYFKNLLMNMFSMGHPQFETVSYRIDGNKLIFGKNKFKDGKVQVVEGGEKIVYETKNANLVLRKIY